MVKIGHARISENKTIDGERGDQTKAEVSITDYYNKPWDYVIRAKNPQMGLRIANAMKMVCNNDNIGYGQHFRNDIITEGEKVEWVFSKITKPINCDCSSAVTACVINAGIPKNKVYKNNNAMTTRTIRPTLEKTGEFEIIGDKKYISDPKNLKMGDILLAEGSHTAVVVEVDKKIEYYPQYNGNISSLVSALQSCGEKDVSLNHRGEIYKANGLEERYGKYKGTADQNTAMLIQLKRGMLIKA